MITIPDIERPEFCPWTHPNNNTTLVGADSQLIYACIYTALRRNGSLTKGQEAMRTAGPIHTASSTSGRGMHR